MPNESHEIIDDFELDMDIETITLDDIDLREFEEPLPQEFASSPSSMEVGSIGNIENIQIDTASFGGGAPATSAGGENEPIGSPMPGGFSLQPEEITLSAPSITIQTENLTVSAPSTTPSPTTRETAPSPEPGVSEPVTGSIETPPIESLNVDELEFGMGSPLQAEESSHPQEPEVPIIEKDETLHLLSEEEPPLQTTASEETLRETPSPLPETPETPTTPEEAPRPLSDQDEIISLSGEELDKFLYGDTIEGVEVVPEETSEEVVLPPVEETSQEILVSPEAVASEAEPVFIESSKNQVPLEENFELIVESADTTPVETIYASEPTEVLRESQEGPERETSVSLPDLQALDTVIETSPAPSSQAEESTPSPEAEVLPLETEELSLEPISLEEEPLSLTEKTPGTPFFDESEPHTIEMVEAEPTLVDVGQSPLVSELSAESPTLPPEENVDFQFDLSAIPDLQPTVEDENEPIALSLDELNKIEVTAEPPLPMASVSPEEDVDKEIASVGPENAMTSEPSSLDIPVETEIPLSPESFESIIAEEEKIEEIKQQDLNQLIEIAEPDLESADMTEESEPTEAILTEESLPPIEEAETVEFSLDDLGVGTTEASSEPIVSEAYLSSTPEEEKDRRQMIETNIDALSGTSREELRKVLQYLDNLLADLPEDKIKEFAQSEYYDLYTKIMEKLGL